MAKTGASDRLASGLTVGQGFGELIFDQIEVEDFGKDAYRVAYATVMHLLEPSRGALSARLTVPLPKNAVVDSLQIKVTARRADEAIATEVAELRGSGPVAGRFEIVVDFGTVRTVSAARFTQPTFMSTVEAWNGTEFPSNLLNAPFAFLGARQPDDFGKRLALFRSEVRTERLRISVYSSTNIETLIGDLRLTMPDSPSDLMITIDGGAPAWSLPGPAAKGADAELTTDAWNSSNQRLADLTDAFRALTGDPLDDAMQEHELTLTSREAGVLEVELHESRYRRIRRASIGGGKAALSPDAEGVTEVVPAAAGTPAGAVAEEISMTVSGAFGPERRVPVTGPDPVMSGDAAVPLVELEMTSERAVLFRLAPVEGLPAFDGLRLPLVAGADGAEARLQPWSNAGPGRVQPDAALPDLIGEPVTLPAGGDTPEWLSYLFAGPLEIDPANAPWVAILVNRGTVTVGLSDMAVGTLRLGPPSGPWRAPPALLGAPGFAALRLPWRAIGQAEDPLLPPPVLLGVAGAPPLPLDPSPSGTRMTLSGLAAVGPKIAVTHHGAGELKLADIDIVTDI